MIGNNQFYGDINSRYLISDQVNISKMKSKDKLPENSGKVPLTCKIWNRLLLMMNNFFRGDRGNFARINLNDNKMTPYEAHKSEIFQNQNSIPIKGYSTNLFENIQTSDMALSASATAGVLPSPLGEALKTINIIYTNDLHGAIRPVEKKSGDKVGGISHVVTVIKDLKDMVKKADFAVLGANIESDKPGTLDEIKPYSIKEINGVKVGILGLTLTKITESAKSENLQGLKIRDPVEIANKYVSELREKGIDIVLVLAHDTDKEVERLAKSVNGIDVIVNGHPHKASKEPKKINRTEIVQGGSKGEFVGNLELKIDPVTKKLVVSKNELIPVNTSEIKADPEVEGIIAPALKAAKDKEVEVVGETDLELKNSRVSESILGNVITDAMREHSGSDVAMLNSSGIREDIKAGNITFGDLYKVLPFESRLTTMELTGRQIKEILEQSVSKRDNIMQISGVSMYVDPEKPEGQKLSNIKIKSTYLDMDKVYRVTVDNFIAGGGDGYKTFMEGKNIEYGTLLVDSLCTYMKNHSPLTDDHAKIEGRISFKEIN